MPDKWSPSYLQSFSAFVNDPRSEQYAEALLDRHLATLPQQRGFRLLDVCCGTGIFGRKVERILQSKGKFVETTFLDKSENIADDMRLVPTDHVLVRDVTHIHDVEANHFDIAVCRYGFNNLPQESWLRALNEVLRIIKPGGMFLLQDHFVPGPTFSALVNEAEQYMARLEGKEIIPFIFSTEAFNQILDEHPLVESRVKAPYDFKINIWERLRAKKDSVADFEAAKQSILAFYHEVCLKKYQVLVVNPDEYIPVFNVSYAIIKRRTSYHT